MKKIFFIAFSAGFTSTGFAQSSVADVPQNKSRPASVSTPATKSPVLSTAQKSVAPQLVLNSVGLNAHAQPNLQATPVKTKPADQKPVDRPSSVNESPAVKKDN